MIRITYVWHDCFVVETNTANFIFDFWRDPDVNEGELPLSLQDISRDKPLYVLVSHGHKDHYNPRIFEWSRSFDNITYIVSKDVAKRIRHIISETSVYSGAKVSADIVVMLTAGNSIEKENVKVTAFPSTDIGNSYLVETDGIRIFHAGDLNAWIWLDESTEQEVHKAMGDFKACVREIKNYITENYPGERQPRIDYLFFPVDSRIGRNYWTGAQLFLKTFDTGHFFPMHFGLGSDEEVAQRERDAFRFDLYANSEYGEYIPLALPNSTFVKEGIEIHIPK